MEDVKPRNRLWAFYEKVLTYLSFISCALLALITLAVTSEVLVRKIGSTSLPWVIECSEHALVFITFFAGAWVLRHEAHIRVDIVLSLLGAKARAMLNVVNSILGAALCLFLTYRSTLTVLDLWKRHIYTIKTLEIPMAPLYAVISFGSFLLTVQFFLRILRYYREWKTDSPANESNKE